MDYRTPDQPNPTRPQTRRRSGLTTGLITGTVLGLAIGAGTTALVLGGGGDGRPAQAAATPAASRSASKGAAVRLGQAQTFSNSDGAVRATVYQYRTLKTTTPPQRRGDAYAGIEVRVCVTRVGAGKTSMGLSWVPWALQYGDDTDVQPLSSWDSSWFSVPLYAGGGSKTLRAGRCSRGWIPFEVRRGSRPQTVAYAPEDAAPFEWRLT